MSRHASLADQLKGVFINAKQPDHDPEPLQSNWQVAPVNDNDEAKTELHTERRVAMRPTIDEIVKQIETDDFEYGSYLDDHGKPHKITVRIGRLRFSDGKQMERCLMNGPDDKTIEGSITMPIGAMLGMKDVQERALGQSGGGKGESNVFFAEFFDVFNRQYIPGGKRRSGRNYTREEAIAILEEAKANTEVMPIAYQCEDGFALGTPNVADNFIGMKKSPKGNGGSIAWQDISDRMAEREAHDKAIRDLCVEDRAVLETSKTARNMGDIGSSIGFSGKHAERRGKRALIAANDNLMAAINKYAA